MLKAQEARAEQSASCSPPGIVVFLLFKGGKRTEDGFVVLHCFLLFSNSHPPARVYSAIKRMWEHRGSGTLCLDLPGNARRSFLHKLGTTPASHNNNSNNKRDRGHE